MSVAMPPCESAEFLWERYALEGREAFEKGEVGEAEGLWRTGFEMTEGFDACDPRRAASLNNLAATRRRHDDFPEAETLYGEALAAWKQVPDWIARMRVELTARGMIFHLRLELKHRERFIALGRMENERLAEGGLAATLNNLAELLDATGRGPEAEPLYRHALEARARSLGPRGEGLARIYSNLAALYMTAGRKRDAAPLLDRACQIRADPSPSGEARFAAEKGTKMSDARKLKAAVYLTPLLRRSA